METIIIIVVIIGIVIGVLYWGEEAKGEGGLTGCALLGGMGGLGCFFEILPILIIISIIMFCCS